MAFLTKELILSVYGRYIMELKSISKNVVTFSCEIEDGSKTLVIMIDIADDPYNAHFISGDTVSDIVDLEEWDFNII